MDEFEIFNTLLNQPWTLPQQGYGNPMPSANSISPYQPAYADPFNFQGIPNASPMFNNGFVKPSYQGPGINMPSPGGPAVNLPAGYQSAMTGMTPALAAATILSPPEKTDKNSDGETSAKKDEIKLSPTQAAIGAAPGVIGGIYGGITNLRRRNDLEREDLTPTQVYSGAADAFRREKSALTPNYAQTVDSINRRAGDVVKTAERVGGSAGQVIDAAISANTAAGDQLFNLDMAGADRQSRNRARADEYRNTLGEYQRMSDDRYKQQYAAYDRGAKDSFMNAFNTAAGFGMMSV